MNFFFFKTDIAILNNWLATTSAQLIWLDNYSLPAKIARVDNSTRYKR